MSVKNKNKDLYKLTEQKEKETLKKIEESYQETYNFIKKEIAKYADAGELSRTEIYKYKRYENLVKTIENELKNIEYLKQNELYNYVYDQYSLNYYYNGFIYETEYGKPLNYQQLPKNTIKSSIENDLAKISLAENSLTVRSNIQKALTQSITLGLNINEAGDLIKKALETNANNVYRIYRTETTRASNKGKLDSIEHANTYGLDLKKQWLATLDTRTRDSHGAVDGELKNKDDKFSNGLMYPGDPEGGASEVINCRCTMLSILPGYENSRLYRIERDIDDKTKEIPYTNYKEWEKSRLNNKEPLVVNKETGKATTPSKPQAKYKYKEVKKVKEANEYVKKELGIKNVDYTGLDITTINEMNKSLFNNINEFPELKDNFNFVGESRARNKFYKDILTKETYVNLRKLNPGISDEILKPYADKYIRKTMRNLSVSKRTYAQSISVEAVKEIKGVTINNDFGKNSKLFTEKLINDVKSKFHPVGTDTIKSVFDHEIGHQIDSLLNLRNNKDLQNIFNRYSKEELTNNLSRYAWDNANANKYSEFIAEAWSEYKNNSKPREIATEVGQLIEREYIAWKKK